MAILLGGIELPDLVLDSAFFFGNSGVRSVMNESRNGTPLIFEESGKFKEADLAGSSDTGWTTYKTLKDLQSIANVPNSEYTLSYEGVDYTVCFRNWNQPVIEANAIVPRPNHEDSDLFNNVRIKLLIMT